MSEINIETIEFYGQQIPITKGDVKDGHGEFHVDWESFIDPYQTKRFVAPKDTSKIGDKDE